MGATRPLVLAVMLAACAGRGRTPRAVVSTGTPPVSNILRTDYAGSEACAGCHPKIYEAWRHSPMHNMTRLPAQASVRAPFDGATFSFKQDSAHFDSRGDARFVRLHSVAYGDHLYRVTKVIGGRYREDFAGREVSSTEPDAPVIGNTTDELILPVSYVFDTRSFRLKGYSVMVGERPGLKAGGVWNRQCILCHNTAPLFDGLWGAVMGAGAPSYQGEVVDRALPSDRRFHLRITDPVALMGALSDEVSFLGGAPSAAPAAVRPTLAAAIHTIDIRLNQSHLVEVGIGCEACHGGSRAHVYQRGVLPSFAPQSPFLKVVPPPGHGEITRAESINRGCACCHQVLFSRYPWTWEGETRRGGAPGGSHITSGEARDFLLGGCARQMACTACHDPHGEDDRAKLAALATPAGNHVCTTCHGAYAEPKALKAHAHHDPAGAGGACIACHMPRKNMGLGYELTRYHRIGSPTDRARVEGDRPLECVLCHQGARVQDMLSAVERFWGKTYDRRRLTTLYGALDASVLRATVTRGKAHEQAVAVAALGEAHITEATQDVAGQLANPYPLVRYYARRSLERLTGHPVRVDIEAGGVPPSWPSADDDE